MNNLKINPTQKIIEIKETVRLNISQFPSSEYDFSWLNNIIDNSMDEYLLEYLTSNPPNLNQYIYNDAEEHFIEINSLLSKCNSIRDEIYRIESIALLTGVEYHQLINSIDDTEKIEYLSLKANFNLSSEVDFEKYNQIQNNLNQTIRNSINIKFSLHNQKGNALNFGERVGYLRDIYSDTVRILYERIIALKRTLIYSFNQSTNPIPNYLEIKDNLYELTIWIRSTLRQYEVNNQNEQFVYKTLYLSSNCNLQALKQQIEFNEVINPEELYQQFKLTGNSDFLIDLDNEFDPKYYNVRIAAVSINVINYIDKYLTTPPLGFWTFEDIMDEDDQIIRTNRNTNINNGKISLNDQMDKEMLHNKHYLYDCLINAEYQPDALQIDNLFNDINNSQEYIDYITELKSRKNISIAISPLEGVFLDGEFPPLPKIINNFPILGFYNINSCFGDSIKESLTFNSNKSINNLKTGKWNIQIKPASFFSKTYFAHDADDVAITLKLAVRSEVINK